LKNIKVLCLIAALFLFAAMASCAPIKPAQDPAVLRAKYDHALALFHQLEIGMSYDQAIELLGPPVEKTAVGTAGPSDVPPVPQPSGYFWQFNGEDNNKDGTIYYLFEPKSGIGNKTFSWITFDLAFSEGALSTSAKYDSVVLGMTYEQVKNIMGTPGRLVRQEEQILPSGPLVGSFKTGWHFPLKPRVTQAFSWWPDGGKDAFNVMNILFIQDAVSSKSYRNKTVAS
jgi:outer membrane protein assembly factor BamE (lipoprotein component of BamABCDE complex)